MTKIKDLQEIEITLAKKFVKICNDNHLRYYMIGGTFLGAIRHKGFIPWDDDMDFGMPRTDYDRFKSLTTEMGSLKIRHYTLSDADKYSFMKVVDDSIMVEIHNGKEIQVVPSWIDIFPLDNIPKNSVQKKAHIIKLLFIRMLISFKNIDRLDTVKKDRPSYEKALIYIATHFNFGKILNLKKLYIWLDKTLSKYSDNQGYYWINIMGSYKGKEIFPKSVFGEGKEYKFENTTFIGPEKADEYLSTLYGDYMKLPDENNRNHHKSEILE